MADVSVKYKGAEIAVLDDTGTKTLKTSGKYYEGDIAVEYVKPQGGLVPVVEIAGTFSSTTTLRFTYTADALALGAYLAEITFTYSNKDYKCFMWLNVKRQSLTQTTVIFSPATPSDAYTVDGLRQQMSSASGSSTYFSLIANSSIFSKATTVSSAKLYHAEDVFA